MKYKAGDTVTIRKDIRYGTYFHEDNSKSMIAIEPMVEMAGMTATITVVNSLDMYYLDIDNGEFHWVDGMFEDGKPSEDSYDDVDMLGFMEVFNEI